MNYTKQDYERDLKIVEDAPGLFADRYDFYSERDHAFYTMPDEANIAIAYYIATGSTSHESSMYIDYGSVQRLDDLRDKIALYETVERLKDIAGHCANVGNDWGYGRYELGQEIIQGARELLKELTND